MIEKDTEQHSMSSNFMAWKAVEDAQERNRRALDSNPTFFADTQHQQRIEIVKQICRDTFGTKYLQMYVNHRDGGGRPGRRPFTAVKVSNPSWPPSQKERREKFYDPLTALEKGSGNEIAVVNTPQGVLIRIY